MSVALPLDFKKLVGANFIWPMGVVLVVSVALVWCFSPALRRLNLFELEQAQAA